MSLSWNEIQDRATEFRDMLPGASLGDLYDPLTMPSKLSKAHKALDCLYCEEAFVIDTDCVATLFKQYQNATRHA